MSKFLASGRDSSPILFSRESPRLFLFMKDKQIINHRLHGKIINSRESNVWSWQKDEEQSFMYLKVIYFKNNSVQGVTRSDPTKLIMYALNPFVIVCRGINTPHFKNNPFSPAILGNPPFLKIPEDGSYCFCHKLKIS